MPHATSDGTSAHGTLAIFVYPQEAQALGVPSCLQYCVTLDASRMFISMHEQLQLTLASSLME